MGAVVSIVQGLLDGGAVQDVIGLVTGLLQANVLGAGSRSCRACWTAVRCRT